MTMLTINDIYTNYRATDEYPPNYTLDFFEKNNVQLHSINDFKDDSELKLFIELSWQHLNALFLKDRYNETIDYAVKYLKIIDIKVNPINLKIIKDDWYYGILLFKGMASYKLRDYKVSTPIFKELTIYDSKNENYKQWLVFSNYGLHSWISKTITIVCGLLLLFEILFKKYIQSFQVRILIDGIALTGFLGTMIYDYYIKRSFRNSNQT